MHDIKIQKVYNLFDVDIAQLLSESLDEGYNHIGRLVSDYEGGQNRFDQEGEALFIALVENQVVGVCGLNEDPFSENDGIGRVRRMYVSKAYRRHGIGRRLMYAVLSKAKEHYRMIVLRTNNPEADAFYKSLGFIETIEFLNSTHALAFADSALVSTYKQLEVVNLDKVSNSIQDSYKNFIINQVNDSCLRLAVFSGEYRWHYHASSDEMFLVLEGELIIDFKDRETVRLYPHDVITIPAGVVHRTRSTQRTVNLCFELLDGDTTFVDEEVDIK